MAKRRRTKPARSSRKRTTVVTAKKNLSGKSMCGGCHKAFLGVLAIVVGALLYYGVATPWIWIVVGVILVASGLVVHNQSNCTA